eukprot:GHVS01105424.1.p1 GENE.GHVS01105424.1~~GHVS01105424.1.p1  ORF type:complete len:356 (+),score=56.76 GHVS01105424.1:219-1286(+)
MMPSFFSHLSSSALSFILPVSSVALSKTSVCSAKHFRPSVSLLSATMPVWSRLSVVCIAVVLSCCLSGFNAQPYYSDGAADYGYYGSNDNYYGSNDNYYAETNDNYQTEPAYAYNQYFQHNAPSYYDSTGSQQQYYMTEDNNNADNNAGNNYGFTHTGLSPHYSPSATTHFSSGETTAEPFSPYAGDWSQPQTTPATTRPRLFSGLRRNSNAQSAVVPSNVAVTAPAVVQSEHMEEEPTTGGEVHFGAIEDVTEERRRQIEVDVGDYENAPFELMEPDAHYTSLYLLDRPLNIINNETNGSEQTNFMRYPRSSPPPKRYSTRPMFEPIASDEQLGVILKSIAAKGLLNGGVRRSS